MPDYLHIKFMNAETLIIFKFPRDKKTNMIFSEKCIELHY